MEAEVDALAKSVELFAQKLQGLEEEGGVQKQRDAALEVRLRERLRTCFAAIGKQLSSLDVTFRDAGQLRRDEAAVKLGAWLRGYLERCRYQKARAALQSWTSRELMAAQLAVVAWLRTHEESVERLRLYVRAKQRQQLAAIVQAWRSEALANRPARRLLDCELRARRHYARRLQWRALDALRRVCHMLRLRDSTWVTRGGVQIALSRHEVLRLQLHLRAWRRWTVANRSAERQYHWKEQVLASNAFGALAAATRRQRWLRQHAIEEWLHLTKTLRLRPFKAWNAFVFERKMERQVRATLLAAFARRREKRSLGVLVGAWRELARSAAAGEPFELRTRPQLLEALHAQERLSRSLESSMGECAAVLEEAEQALRREWHREQRLRAEIEEAKQHLLACQVEKHAAAAEALRMRSAVRQYELRYPRAFAEPGDPSNKLLPPTPHLVGDEERAQLSRLRASRSFVSGRAQQVRATAVASASATSAWGDAAALELRMLLTLLEWLEGGQVAEDAPAEICQIATAQERAFARVKANAAALSLSDDLIHARPLRLPLDPAESPSEEETESKQPLEEGGAAADDSPSWEPPAPNGGGEALDPAAFADFRSPEPRLGPGDAEPEGGVSGEAQGGDAGPRESALLQRVRAHRQSVLSKLRGERVNLYQRPSRPGSAEQEAGAGGQGHGGVEDPSVPGGVGGGGGLADFMTKRAQNL